MRQNIFIVLICLISLESLAQQSIFFVGTKGGINLSNASLHVTGSNFNFGNKGKIGMCAGINSGYRINDKLFLLAEVNFDQLGYKFPVTFSTPTGFDIGSDNIVYAYNYLSIPLSINYILDKKKLFEAGLGINNGILLTAQVKYPSFYTFTDPRFGNDLTDDIKEYYNSYEAGGFIRLAVNPQINSKLSLVIESRFTQGLTSSKKLKNETQKNSVLFLGVGLRLNLIKKIASQEKVN